MRNLGRIFGGESADEKKKQAERTGVVLPPVRPQMPAVRAFHGFFLGVVPGIFKAPCPLFCPKSGLSLSAARLSLDAFLKMEEEFHMIENGKNRHTV